MLAGSRPTLHLYDLQTYTESIVDVSPVCTRVGEVYLSETHVVFRIQDRGAVFWDHVTPGASPVPSPEHWRTPQPTRLRWFAAPITR